MITNEPRHQYYGTPLSEWIERVPNELPADAVGLWQVVIGGREGFGLVGEPLESFVRRCIWALVDRGACPVVAANKPGIYWERQPQYGASKEQIADLVIREWKESGVDPDHDGIWFALV